MASLQGLWRVEREAGFLPPFGVTKSIGSASGWTLLFGLPVGFFEVRGRRLRYRGWPIVDEVTPRGDGSWSGRGLLAGREFCRFRLVRKTAA